MSSPTRPASGPAPETPTVDTIELGEVQIHRVIEFSDTTPMTTDVFFPNSTPEEWQRHTELLAPHHWDPETDLTRAYLAEPGMRASMEALVPAGRLGRPDDLVGLREPLGIPPWPPFPERPSREPSPASGGIPRTGEP